MTNQVNKYIWLVKTIQIAGQMTFQQISNAWMHDMEAEPLLVRTFRNWRNEVEEMFSINIECSKKYPYFYSIKNPDRLEQNNLYKWLVRSFSVTNLLHESKSIHNRILLEDVPSGDQFLMTIVDAMRKNKVISLTHYAFNYTEPKTYDVEPYCVKLDNQRWYMLGHRIHDDKMRLFALDRMKGVVVTKKKFKLPKDFNAKEYFADYYGTYLIDEYDLCTVKVKVKAWQSNYLRSLPLHHSQKETVRNDKYSIFEYTIRPTLDFQQALLQHGSDLEVLEPLKFRNEMKETVKNLMEIYK